MEIAESKIRNIELDEKLILFQEMETEKSG